MDLAAEFNNIGVALHRLQRYEEAEEMFKGAVQLLLRSKGSMLLNQNCCADNVSSNPLLFEYLVQDDLVRMAASKAEDQAVHHVDAFASNESIPSMTSFHVAPSHHSSNPPPSSIPPSMWPPSSSSPSPVSSLPSSAFHQAFPQENNNSLFADTISERSSWENEPMASSPMMMSSVPSSTFKDEPSHRLSRSDESIVYICLDAILLDANTAAEISPLSTAPSIPAPSITFSAQAATNPHHLQATAATTVTATSSSTLLQDNMKNNPNGQGLAIGRYDFETIVVLYNMALTLHCLGQLTLSCFIYDLADRVLRGQPMEKVRKDHVACKLAMAISNNLCQIFLKLGYWDIARAYVHRLADFMLGMDPPANAEQAKERLEFVLNIYWFDKPPSAPAA